MKILVTGYTGQLGYDVVQRGLKVGLSLVGLGSENLNIINGETVSHYVKELIP